MQAPLCSAKAATASMQPWRNSCTKKHSNSSCRVGRPTCVCVCVCVCVCLLSLGSKGGPNALLSLLHLVQVPVAELAEGWPQRPWPYATNVVQGRLLHWSNKMTAGPQQADVNSKSKSLENLFCYCSCSLPKNNSTTFFDVMLLWTMVCLCVMCVCVCLSVVTLFLFVFAFSCACISSVVYLCALSLSEQSFVVRVSLLSFSYSLCVSLSGVGLVTVPFCLWVCFCEVVLCAHVFLSCFCVGVALLSKLDFFVFWQCLSFLLSIFLAVFIFLVVNVCMFVIK